MREGHVHSVLQFSVEILLDGPTDAAFTAADNSLIIPTDTQKNTVYVLAKTTSFDCAEEFAVIVARWAFVLLLVFPRGPGCPVIF